MNPEQIGTPGSRVARGARPAVFFSSFFCICLELFFTRILNFKTWNHVVYFIIPFAILGFGIGANFYLVFKNHLARTDKRHLLAVLLYAISGSALFTTHALIHMPVYLDQLAYFFVHGYAALTLCMAYAILMIPFVFIGFLIVWIFSENAARGGEMYFWDMLGAAAGAVGFFLLIGRLEVFHSIALISAAGFFLCAWVSRPDKKWMAVAACGVILSAGILASPEPEDYRIDPAKGWEWIPGNEEPGGYDRTLAEWSPLGRTDAYRFKDPQTRERFYREWAMTFELNTSYVPDYSVFVTNFLASSPVYRFPVRNSPTYDSEVVLFSKSIECPYVLLKRPKVVVIGTGGGRDIFIAKTHGASEIRGAEINPAIYAAMSAGGTFHDYSGRVYSGDGVWIENLDGRHLVKKLPGGRYDLIVLNGVDTLSGLSSGAYAYAESYLYTKNAIRDYLRVLGDSGMINFFRWAFPPPPRETLRLFAIVLEALRESGVSNPLDHVIVGIQPRWGILLVKKTPFTAAERSAVVRYLSAHRTKIVIPPGPDPAGAEDAEASVYAAYAKSFSEGKERQFARDYPYDISAVTDDNPFFYKYYRWGQLKLRQIILYAHPAHGTVVFLTQLLVFVHALGFIAVFIVVPLFKFKREGIRLKNPWTFIVFFGSLGAGYMFVEIPMMQKLTLLLGSPIHSISVTLAALLGFTGLGSLFLPRFQKIAGGPQRLLVWAFGTLGAGLFLLITFGSPLLDAAVGLSMIWRVAVVCLIQAPFGVCLGLFFPSGLAVIGAARGEAVAWAWGINCGFTVLGSILAITIAQFAGFHAVFYLAAACYAFATVSFFGMSRPDSI